MSDNNGKQDPPPISAINCQDLNVHQLNITSGVTVSGSTITNTSQTVPPVPTGPNEPGPGNLIEPPKFPDPTPTTEKGKNVARILLGSKRMEVYLKKLMPALYRITESPDVFADLLKANGVLSTYQKEECQVITTPYKKNSFLYDIICKKNAVELFILALEESDNHYTIGIIETFLTTRKIPQFQ